VNVSEYETDVAIVGAGPYGLSLAAHLKAAGVDVRVFGKPMGFWRDHMPRGMQLKSEAASSSLSDPLAGHTLAAFCDATNRAFNPRGTPVPLSTFVTYGEWFQREVVQDVEHEYVIDVARDRNGFRLTLATGDVVTARRVVIATGVQHFAHVPRVLSGLPPYAVSHSSDHADLGTFRGRDVLVVGAGQSALESAALLAEHGARAHVVARVPQLSWNTEPLPDGRSLARRLREPQAPLGSGWPTWFYSEHPALFRRLPESQRIRRASTALGPAGAWWLRPRVEERCEVLLGHEPVAAQMSADAVRLSLRTPAGDVVDVVGDHVIAATGYRVDLTRLGILGPDMTRSLVTCNGGPKVSSTFESSLSGLFFIGPAVASTFGPAMRFVWGAAFAARVVAQRIAAESPQRTRAKVG
jgi:lysine/ornithine N-monooxygenase